MLLLGLMTSHTKGCIPLGLYHLSIMGYPGAQTWDATEANHIQFRFSNPCNCKGIGQNHQTPGGSSQHHVKNNMDFIQSIEGIQLKSDECMMSFDVEWLFKSVPIEPSIEIIKKLLEDDRSLHLRTKMTGNQISCQLEFCLKTTCFTFQGKFF